LSWQVVGVVKAFKQWVERAAAAGLAAIAMQRDCQFPKQAILLQSEVELEQQRKDLIQFFLVLHQLVVEKQQGQTKLVVVAVQVEEQVDIMQTHQVERVLAGKETTAAVKRVRVLAVAVERAVRGKMVLTVILEMAALVPLLAQQLQLEAAGAAVRLFQHIQALKVQEDRVAVALVVT
tara:strand:- start:411 stop:944 length:534 start_codon:yes stop_codon:yes gene_type:complete